MKTDFSLFGGLLKRNNSPFFSQEELVSTGFTHIANNNNDANCMNNLTIDPKEKIDFIREKLFNKSNFSSKGLRILMILGLFLFSFSVFGQVTIWSENFTETDGTENGTNWTTTLTGKVWIQGNRIEATNLDAEGIWASNPITISGYSSVSFSMDVDTQADTSQFEDGTDYFIGEYRIDSGSWVEFENESGDSPSNLLQSSYTVNLPSTGGSLEIRVRFYNTASNESYYIDNVLVQGTPTIGLDSDGDGIPDITDNCPLVANVGQLDTDGDGIGNICDGDDDNDGILDEEECSETICLEPITNAGFESPVIAAGTYSLINESSVPGWLTTATDNLIEYWATGFLGVPSFEGNQFAELNATQNSALYQALCLTPGSVITWSVRHRGRSGTDVARVRIGATLGSATTQATMSTNNTTWGLYSGTYTVPLGQISTFFIFEAVSTAGGNISVGNFIDDIQITVVSTPPCLDSDNDGVPNDLDIDADNDGIFDIVEAGNGALDTNNDGIIDLANSGTVGTNGIYDPLETAPDSGTVNPLYAANDTDGDGSPDHYDYDSDADGCLDVIEAGFTESATNPGELQGTGYSATNGTVTGGIDGYTTPNDGDSNSTYDFQQPYDIVISDQPLDQPICLNGNGSFSVTATGSGLSYQWQISTGGAFSDLSNGGDYSTVTTNILNITTAPQSLNGNQYRVIITSSAYTCGTVTSDAALLSIPDVTYDSYTLTDPTTFGGTDGRIQFTQLEGSTTYAVSYIDDGSPVGPINISSDPGGVLRINGLDAGSYTNIVLSLLGCSSSPIDVVLSDTVADLSLEKTVDKVKPNIGDAITFTIVVTNNGPGSVSGVSVKDILQPGLSYVSNTATAGSYISATGIWDFTTEILVAGDTETLTITATIDPNCDEILNRAEIISSNLTDTDSTPNSGG